jgi:hypothetical protein
LEHGNCAGMHLLPWSVGNCGILCGHGRVVTSDPTHEATNQEKYEENEACNREAVIRLVV